MSTDHDAMCMIKHSVIYISTRCFGSFNGCGCWIIFVNIKCDVLFLNTQLILDWPRTRHLISILPWKE